MSITHLHPPTEEQQAAFNAFIEKVYEDWADLEDCRVTIPGEGMWGKLLPEYTPPGSSTPVKLFGINNMPLDSRFQWQDIHVGTGGEVTPGTHVHRRWHSKVWFEYKALDDEVAEKAQRKAIWDALKPIGEPGFFSKGFGYVLMTTENYDEALSALAEALGDKGSVYVPKEDE